MMMRSTLCIWLIILFISDIGFCEKSNENRTVGPQLVKREERETLVQVEDVEISAVEISDGIKGPYNVHFFTLQPNALFLPVLLHSDCLLFVHSGRGRLSWTDEDSLRMGAMQRGDLFRLEPGSIFYVHSSPSLTGEKLSFFAFFSYTDKDQYEPSLGAYSRLSGMITNFDAKILQSAFKLTPQVAEEIANAMEPPAIVNAPDVTDMVTPFLRAAVASRQPFSHPDPNGKQKKHSPYNVFNTEPDFESCYGWTLSVKDKKLQSLGGSDVAIFMVNMTKGSMVAPHWNPKATEVSVVLHGEGMVRVSCSGIAKNTGCKSVRFKVREGDVFSTPKFHPMAQIAFNYNQLAIMGFSKMDIKNSPPAEFVAGKKSVLQILKRSVLAKTLNVGYETAYQLLSSEDQSVLLECTSCAEAEEMKMEEKAHKEREEEPWKETEEYPREREPEKEGKEKESAEREPEEYSQTESEQYPEEREPEGTKMEGFGGETVMENEGERAGRRIFSYLHNQGGQWSKFLKYAYARWWMGSKYHS